MAKIDKRKHYHVSIDLQQAAIEFPNSDAESATATKTSRSLLKFTQDRFYNRERQNKMVLQAADRTRIRKEELKKQFFESKAELLKKEYPDTLFTEQGDLQKRLDNEYKLVQYELNQIAELEVWKEVLNENIGPEETKFRIGMSQIRELAKIPRSNSDHYWKLMKSVQDVKNVWNEPTLKNDRAEVIYEPARGGLFSKIKKINNGPGREGEVEITLNREMLHFVLFLNKRYLSFVHEASVALGDNKKVRLYELLIETINPTRKNRRWSLVELSKRWKGKEKIANNSLFILREIDEPLKDVNEYFGSQIKAMRVKEKRALKYIDFVITKEDEGRLSGAEPDPISLYEGELTESFGYFLALNEYFCGAIEKSSIGRLGISMERQIEDGELEPSREEYQRYTDNLSKYLSLLQLWETGVFSDKVYLDETLLTLFLRETGKPLANFAMDCYDEALRYTKDTASTPLLPGMELPQKKAKSIEDFLPFRFSKMDGSFDVVHASNYSQYEKMIKMAIRYGDIERFKFESEEIMEEFECDVMLRSSSRTLEAVVVPEVQEEEASAPEPAPSLADKMHDMFRRINPKTRSSVAACTKAIDEILSDKDGDAYTLEDIATVMHWLEYVDTKAKKPFYSTIIKTHTQFKKNFEQLYAHAQASAGSAGATKGGQGPDVNILDALENS